jgi:hypothetical protein
VVATPEGDVHRDPSVLDVVPVTHHTRPPDRVEVAFDLDDPEVLHDARLPETVRSFPLQPLPLKER